MNNLRYYLKNEHKEKWSMAWRVGLLGVAFILIYLIFLGVMFTNLALFFVMPVLIMVLCFFAISIREKILFNQVISKYFDGKKIPLKPVYKKTLAYSLLLIGMFIGFELLLFILMMIMAIASNGFVSFLMLIGIIAISVMLVAVLVIARYAIFETLGTDNFGFGSFFPVWSSMMKTYFKKVVIGLVKSVVLFILGFILYLIFVMISGVIIGLISGLLHLYILMPIYGLALVVLEVAGIILLGGASYQYLMNIHFNKASNIE